MIYEVKVVSVHQTGKFYFDIPDEGPYDLKRALLMAIEGRTGPKATQLRRVMDNFVQGSKIEGSFNVTIVRTPLGQIHVKKLKIHSAKMPPKWYVRILLQGDILWATNFECELKDLGAAIQQYFLDVYDFSCKQEFHEASKLFYPEKEGTWPLVYAGVKIGTATIRRVS